MEGDRRLLFEAMVLPLSELRAGRQETFTSGQCLCRCDRRLGMANSIAHRLL